MPFLSPTSRIPRLSLVLAMLALVLAQALGGWHRIRHGTGGAAHSGIAAQAARDAGHAHAQDAYAHEAGSETCRLLDALAQAGAPPVAPCLLPPAPATAMPALRAGAALVAAAAPFDARGPPAAH